MTGDADRPGTPIPDPLVSEQLADRGLGRGLAGGWGQTLTVNSCVDALVGLS